MRKNISGGSPYEPIIGFSRAVRVGNSVHLSGTGPVGAETKMRRARRAASLRSPQRRWQRPALVQHVVRTRMYLTHVEDWEAVGRVHGEFLARCGRAPHGVVAEAAQSGMAHRDRDGRGDSDAKRLDS